jgi:hypothetical protein
MLLLQASCVHVKRRIPIVKSLDALHVTCIRGCKLLEWMQNVGFEGDITEINVASSYGIKITQK